MYLLWYSDLAAREDALQGVHYPTVPSGALQDVAVYGPPHGWSQRYVERVVVPQVLMPGLGNRVRGGNADTGMALMQGYLAAVDEGLGACLVPFDEAGARRVVDVPEDFEPAAALLIGYPAESPEAGGQRPHGAWEECFFDADTNTPFPRDAEVTAKLEEAGLLQTPAPLPWRDDEVRALSRGLGLAGGGVEAPSGVAPEGAPVNLGPIRDYASVGEWRKSVSKFWRATPPPDDWLETLEAFCRFAGTNPDAIIDEILSPAPTGEGLLLRTRARRKWVELIDEFEGYVGREKANHIRSFVIHNGVAMNPSILR